MFQALLKLAQQGDLNLSVRATQGENPTMTIIVMPVAKSGQDPALATPVRLSGTVDEIQAGFASAIDRFAGTRATLIEQLEATETILKNAQAASAKKGTDALKGKPGKPAAAVPVKAAAAPAPGAGAANPQPEGSDDDDDSPLGGAPLGEAPRAETADRAEGNLFGM